jgi:hypothetical protein
MTVVAFDEPAEAIIEWRGRFIIGYSSGPHLIEA